MLAKRVPHLDFVPTMQPTLVDAAPDGDEWLHEIKYDGYRSGYGTAWLKTKAFTEEHFVIVGTEQGIGPTTALCARETPHGLEYVGGAMLTLTDKERERFQAAAERLRRSTPPVKIEKRKAAQWLEPDLQARVRHLRGEEKLRHATVVELL